MRKIILLLLTFFSLSIYGQYYRGWHGSNHGSNIPDPLPNTYVNDWAKVLSAKQLQELNDSILSIEKKSSVQIAVILVDKLPSNMEIEQYTMEIGRKWHVGNARNGLVYAASISEHKHRLEVANNLQGDIPDIDAQAIIDDVKPYYKSEDYYGGLKTLLSEINERIDPVLKEQKKLAEAEQKKKDAKLWHGFMIVFGWLVGIGLMVASIWFIFFRGKYLRKRELEEKKNADREKRWMEGLNRKYDDAGEDRKSNRYIPPVIITPPIPDDSSYRTSSSDSGSSGSSSSDYGNWGSGSSDTSSSSDSGFSGGGASGGW